MKDVYERLRERLDDLSTGYPATQSGVEIRILQRLFTEEEAEFFLKLSPLPEVAGEDQPYQPPQCGAETYIRIAVERGKNLMP